MFSPVAFANSRPSGVAVLEVLPDDRRPGAYLRFVPLKRTVANGRWDGPLAEITVTHVYGYSQAQCDRVLEAVYRFPLPGDAAIRKVVVTFGDVEIAAELKERKQAEADYAEARRLGHQAALVTRESPDVFTLRVTGLKPDEDVVVETTYVQLASSEGPGWALRIPLTTAPRYARGDESGPSAGGQPLLTYRDPGHRFALDLLTSLPGTVESPTHLLELTEEDGQTRVRLREREVLPDRDCLLLWRPTQERDRPSLHVLLGDDAAAGQTYFLALVSPPAVHAPDRSVPREAIILVDHSGSMDGPKREAADWAVLKLLANLAKGDRYNLCVFDNHSRWLAPAPCPSGPSAAPDGARFLQAEPDGGGTELGVALEQALQQPRAEGDLSRQVVVVTDAQVSDFGRILQLVEQEGRERGRRRVSVLCVDAAPNSFLVREVARRGGGIAHFVTSRPDEGDLVTALTAILARWDQPVLTGLRLEVNRTDVEAPERDVLSAGEPGWSAVDMGDLTAGSTLWVAGRVPTGDARGLAFRLADGSQQPVETRGTRTKVGSAGALKALFGAWRVLGLETLIESHRSGDELRAELARLGYDPDRTLASAGPRAVYRENDIAESRRRLGDLLLGEALNYGLLCSATGFVAVRREQGKSVEATVLVGSALPVGWSEGFAVGSASPASALSCVLDSAVLFRRAAPPGMARAAERTKSRLQPVQREQEELEGRLWEAEERLAERERELEQARERVGELRKSLERIRDEWRACCAAVAGALGEAASAWEAAARLAQEPDFPGQATRAVGSAKESMHRAIGQANELIARVHELLARADAARTRWRRAADELERLEREANDSRNARARVNRRLGALPPDQPPAQPGGQQAGPQSVSPPPLAGPSPWLPARYSYQAPERQPVTLFSGTPQFDGREALLFDSSREGDRDKLAGEVSFSSLRVSLLADGPVPESVDPGLALLLFVGDLAMPVARVALRDVLRLGGTRPLSVLRRADERVLVVLRADGGASEHTAPGLEVALE